MCLCSRCFTQKDFTLPHTSPHDVTFETSQQSPFITLLHHCVFCIWAVCQLLFHDSPITSYSSTNNRVTAELHSGNNRHVCYTDLFMQNKTIKNIILSPVSCMPDDEISFAHNFVDFDGFSGRKTHVFTHKNRIIKHQLHVFTWNVRQKVHRHNAPERKTPGINVSSHNVH